MFGDNKHEHEEISISSLQAEIEYLQQENQRLAQRLKETQLLVDIYREASQILNLILDKKRLNTSEVESGNFDDRLTVSKTSVAFEGNVKARLGTVA